MVSCYPRFGPLLQIPGRTSDSELLTQAPQAEGRETPGRGVRSRLLRDALPGPGEPVRTPTQERRPIRA